MLKTFMTIRYNTYVFYLLNVIVILFLFVVFPPFLVCCVKKNLATLSGSGACVNIEIICWKINGIRVVGV
jgi:hypothetical protein